MNTIKINSKLTKVIAHRGLSGIERENTCPAFVAAGNRSYFGIETDVHTTRDGKFVIIHDETTDRVSSGKYRVNVEDSVYSAIENIVLPDLDGTVSRQDIRIPLLTEYIKICKKYNKICVLEVKNPFAEADLQRMVEEIREMGYIDHVIFISFDLGNCVKLRKLLPSNEIQWLIGVEDVTDEMIETLVDNELDIDMYYKKITREIVDKLHMHEIKINCWTCDNKADAEKLVEFGVDFITTNILE